MLIFKLLGSFYSCFRVDVVIEKTLQPVFGFLSVTSKPENGATVFIDGNKVGETPYKSDKLKSGTYKIKIEKQHYDKAERIVKVADGSDVKIKMYLPPKYKFLTLNATINQYNDLSYGLTFGKMNKFGWFVSAMTNFNFNTKADYECDAEHYVTVDGAMYYPKYTGKESFSSLSIMGGVLMRLSGPVAMRVGVGYGNRTQRYETDNGYWVKDKSISVQGLDASLGLQCNFRGFIVSIDCVTTSFKSFEAKIGLGYGLKNK